MPSAPKRCRRDLPEQHTCATLTWTHARPPLPLAPLRTCSCTCSRATVTHTSEQLFRFSVFFLPPLVMCLCFILRQHPTYGKALRLAQSAELHFSRRFHQQSCKHPFSQGLGPGGLSAQCPWSSLTSMPLTLEIIVSSFANCPSVWVCLVPCG